MRHYICTGGCGGQSSDLGVCQTEDCQKEGEPLTSCDCADGVHKDAGEESNELRDTEA